MDPSQFEGVSEDGRQRHANALEGQLFCLTIIDCITVRYTNLMEEHSTSRSSKGCGGSLQEAMCTFRAPLGANNRQL